jgi:hypothetical protein
VGEFAAVRGLKACKAQTIEVAGYQQRGDISVAGQKSGVAATWMVRLSGKREDQVAFASWDAEARPVARARGVGLSARSARVFGTGAEWAVTWFDAKGLAYARPRVESLPAAEIGHLGAIGPELQEEVAVSAMSGALVAVAPFGKDKLQLGLFQFAPEDAEMPAVKAIGVTHHANKPGHPAVASAAEGTFIAWHEPDGRLAASHFDAAGKETEAACTVAPASTKKRERISLVVTSTGALSMWMEEGAIQTRALDKSGCPISPVWTIAEGRWASLLPLGDGAGAVVAWMASDGRLLAAKLAANGAPPPRGLDIAEGSSGVKDTPSAAGMGGKVAFGWAEAMSSTISSKRLLIRVVNADCFP